MNRNAPLSVKLNVLDKCVTSALVYASETWGGNFHELEIVYRYGIETTLGIRQNVNNEITYIESNRFPLECKIRKNQIKFWINVIMYISEHPEASIAKYIRIGEEAGIRLLKYYRSLVNTYDIPETCYFILEERDYR